MGKRVRGRKRDGRRSSLPPPPMLPGEEGQERQEHGQEHGPVREGGSTAESFDDAGEREPRDSEREGEHDEVPDARGEEQVFIQLPPDLASGAIAAAEVVVLPKSASALLSAALPSSARAKVVPPAEPSSGATPVAMPAAALVDRARQADTEAEALVARQELEEPEPTPIIDMPSLVEASNAETTKPDAAPLAVDAAEEPVARAKAAPDPGEDPGLRRQPSIPDPTEVSFFDPATVDAHVARAHEPSDAHDMHSLSQAELLHRRRGMPEVAARRARLAGYVKIAIGTAAALLVLAVLLHLSARSGRAGGHAGEMLVAPPAAVAATTSEPVKTTAAMVPATPAAVVAVAPDAAPLVAPSTSASVASAASAPDMTAAAAAAAPLAAFAQHALEKGKLTEAIDAGEQATAIDATEARSWLVLGGAYQERGDMVNARRCYRACAEHATRGPVNECRALGGR